MTIADTPHFLLFEDHRCLVDGPAKPLSTVLAQRFDDPDRGTLLVLDAETGVQVDLDLTQRELSLAQQLEKLRPPNTETGDDSQIAAPQPAKRGPGRPRLGVVPREVTLLPRHWAWLNEQPGGASVSLRKLVEQARRASTSKDQVRQAQERAYRFMNTLAGNLAGFEECCRALYAGDATRFREHTQGWPIDVRRHVQRLAEPAFIDQRTLGN